MISNNLINIILVCLLKIELGRNILNAKKLTMNFDISDKCDLKYITVWKIKISLRVLDLQIFSTNFPLNFSLHPYLKLESCEKLSEINQDQMFHYCSRQDLEWTASMQKIVQPEFSPSAYRWQV